MFRTLYRHMGEILTVIVFMAIGVYLFSSMADSRHILENEEEARSFVIEINRQQEQAFNQKAAYKDLDSIIQDTPSLEGFVKISEDKSGKSALYSDEKYIYFMRLEFELNSVDSYMTGQETNRPKGYRLMAWPNIYSTTGELAFYIDQQGVLAVSANPHAQYDGTKNLPPDLKTPASSIERKEGEERSDLWVTRPL